VKSLNGKLKFKLNVHLRCSKSISCFNGNRKYSFGKNRFKGSVS